MTLHKKRFSAISKFSFGASAIAITLSMPSVALAVATSDSVTRSNTAKTAATSQQILHQNVQQTQGIEAQNMAIGEAGSGMSILNNPVWNDLGSQSEFYSNMEKFGFDMCAISLCQVGDNPTDTTDIDEAREWAMKTFYSSVELDAQQSADITEVRRRAAAYTTANAFAVSSVVHNSLAAGGGSAQALEDLVDSAGNLRGDVQASSAIALANYKVAVQQLAVLSSLLDVQAAQGIQDTGLYHEDGGDEFPDAYIEGDFRDDRTRQSVTVPSKGSPN